jgi:hypothetical protein
MTGTLPDREQVERIARDLAPDVVRIRFHVGRDWSEHPAIYFRVVLSDAASRRDRLVKVVETVRERLFNELGLPNSDPIPYFRFRSQSEQETLKDQAWS